MCQKYVSKEPYKRDLYVVKTALQKRHMHVWNETYKINLWIPMHMWKENYKRDLCIHERSSLQKRITTLKQLQTEKSLTKETYAYVKRDLQKRPICKRGQCINEKSRTALFKKDQLPSATCALQAQVPIVCVKRDLQTRPIREWKEPHKRDQLPWTNSVN